MIKVDKNILEQIYEHAASGYPEEICGLCAGPEEEECVVNSIYPCENIQNHLHKENPEKYTRTAVDAYNIDPERWMEVLCKTQANDKAIRLIYHSHIDCGAYFSGEDQRMAAPLGDPSYPEIVYLVVSVIEKKVSETAMFSWNQKEKQFTAI